MKKLGFLYTICFANANTFNPFFSPLLFLLPEYLSVLIKRGPFFSKPEKGWHNISGKKLFNFKNVKIRRNWNWWPPFKVKHVCYFCHFLSSLSIYFASFFFYPHWLPTINQSQLLLQNTTKSEVQPLKLKTNISATSNKYKLYTCLSSYRHFLFCRSARCLCCHVMSKQCELGRVRTASVLWMKLAPFVTMGSWKLQVSTNERSSRKTYLIRQLPLSLLSNYF